ncbi:uncharacterized protein FMAN_11911 [Fusarium mangiferae]|uniref:Uncharacterized protein n=1 Tax=Fusarium mangiferae TaxID=192010 RepID=A0A1L7UFL9_FUSMA|nr:uncharacterized protein FMAN_11911 [Fusarium mangiferae]CVL06815.1 uncharacterized protein FMAN_11911 [Fusarium mangiferae]
MTFLRRGATAQRSLDNPSRQSRTSPSLAFCTNTPCTQRQVSLAAFGLPHSTASSGTQNAEIHLWSDHKVCDPTGRRRPPGKAKEKTPSRNITEMMKLNTRDAREVTPDYHCLGIGEVGQRGSILIREASVVRQTPLG